MKTASGLPRNFKSIHKLVLHTMYEFFRKTDRSCKGYIIHIFFSKGETEGHLSVFYRTWGNRYVVRQRLLCSWHDTSIPRCNNRCLLWADRLWSCNKFIHELCWDVWLNFQTWRSAGVDGKAFFNFSKWFLRSRELHVRHLVHTRHLVWNRQNDTPWNTLLKTSGASLQSSSLTGVFPRRSSLTSGMTSISRQGASPTRCAEQC